MPAKILVTDDEPDLEPLVQQRFRKQIQQGKYEFIFAYNGVEALARLEADPGIQVLMSDINMPVMDGLTLLSKTARFSRIIKVVIVSAYDDMQNIRTAMNHGAFDFLTKPINFEDFEITLEKTLEQVKLLEESRKAVQLEMTNRQLEEVNRRLTELDELKSNFLSTVSHELRTPLTSIKAFAEILLDNQGEDSDTQLHFLEIINNESERLSRLIGDLLDLAKIESGTVAWKMERLDVRQVIQKSLESVSSLAKKHDLSVTFKMPSQRLPVYGDRDKLVQVVTNLISNAIKFTARDGRIEVDACLVGGHNGAGIPINGSGQSDFVQVSVLDSGIGIPQDHLIRIFDKFQQVDNASTRQRGGGIGLGLAICKEIVEHHHGRIWAKSELNLGSTFSFVLPIDSEMS